MLWKEFFAPPLIRSFSNPISIQSSGPPSRTSHPLFSTSQSTIHHLTPRTHTLLHPGRPLRHLGHSLRPPGQPTHQPPQMTTPTVNHQTNHSSNPLSNLPPTNSSPPVALSDPQGSSSPSSAQHSGTLSQDSHLSSPSRSLPILEANTHLQPHGPATQPTAHLRSSKW